MQRGFTKNENLYKRKIKSGKSYVDGLSDKNQEVFYNHNHCIKDITYSHEISWQESVLEICHLDSTVPLTKNLKFALAFFFMFGSTVKPTMM